MSDEKPKEEEGTAKKAAGPNMMLIIIIAVLGTLVVAGGIGAVLMMKSGSHAADEEHAEGAAESEAEDDHGSAPKEKEKDKSKDKGKDKDKKGAKAATLYVALDPPFVVNFEANQGARFLQINVQLMTRDQPTQAILNENLPVLRNDLLFLFSSQTSESVATTEGKEELRKKALEVVRAIVKQEGGKPDQLEAVYFTSFVMQ